MHPAPEHSIKEPLTSTDLIDTYLKETPIDLLKELYDGNLEKMSELTMVQKKIKEQLLSRYKGKFYYLMEDKGKSSGEVTSAVDGHKMTFKIDHKVIWDQKVLNEILKENKSLFEKVIKADLYISESTFHQTENIDNGLYHTLLKARVVKYSSPTLTFAKDEKIS